MRRVDKITDHRHVLETCHLTHLAERQDKAKAIDSQENEDKTVCYPSLHRTTPARPRFMEA